MPVVLLFTLVVFELVLKLTHKHKPLFLRNAVLGYHYKIKNVLIAVDLIYTDYLLMLFIKLVGRQM
jgi:hypothetical protein